MYLHFTYIFMDEIERMIIFMLRKSYFSCLTFSKGFFFFHCNNYRFILCVYYERDSYFKQML